VGIHDVQCRLWCGPHVCCMAACLGIRWHCLCALCATCAVIGWVQIGGVRAPYNCFLWLCMHAQATAQLTSKRHTAMFLSVCTTTVLLPVGAAFSAAVGSTAHCRQCCTLFIHGFVWSVLVPGQEPSSWVWLQTSCWGVQGPLLAGNGAVCVCHMHSVRCALPGSTALCSAHVGKVGCARGATTECSIQVSMLASTPIGVGPVGGLGLMIAPGSGHVALLYRCLPGMCPAGLLQSGVRPVRGATGSPRALCTQVVQQACTS
jgi:hypothetical protein